MKLLDLKIRYKTYEITDKSEFLDNGSCIQLFTGEVGRLNHRLTVALSDRAEKEIEKFDFINKRKVAIGAYSFTLEAK